MCSATQDVWDKVMHYITSLQIFLTAGRKCWSQNKVLNISKLKLLTEDGTVSHQSPLMFNSPEFFAERVYLRYYYKKSRRDDFSEHDWFSQPVTQILIQNLFVLLTIKAILNNYLAQESRTDIHFIDDVPFHIA